MVKINRTNFQRYNPWSFAVYPNQHEVKNSLSKNSKITLSEFVFNSFRKFHFRNTCLTFIYLGWMKLWFLTLLVGESWYFITELKAAGSGVFANAHDEFCQLSHSNLLLPLLTFSLLCSLNGWLHLNYSSIGTEFNGAETNCRIAHNLGILLINNNFFAILFSSILVMFVPLSISLNQSFDGKFLPKHTQMLYYNRIQNCFITKISTSILVIRVCFLVFYRFSNRTEYLWSNKAICNFTLGLIIFTTRPCTNINENSPSFSRQNKTYMRDIILAQMKVCKYILPMNRIKKTKQILRGRYLKG